MSYDLNPFKKQLSSVDEWLKREFSLIRTGQASPAVLDGVKVESYGTPMSVKEVGSVTIEGARSLRIVPWDRSQSKEIEKAITVANLGVSVVVDDQGLRVIFPELTGERRVQIAKTAKEKMEDAKKQVRGIREDVMRDLQAKEKAGGYGQDEIFRLKNEVQKIVDESNKRLDELYAKKEKEIVS